MTIPRFFVAAPLAPGSTGRLDPDQSHQVRSVLRLRTGAAIRVFDGSGAEATATIVSLARDAAGFEVLGLSTPRREPPLRLTIALALLRGERFDLAVQKLTELGVARIVPLAADRRVVSFDDAVSWEKRASRLRRIAREAAEQSERLTLPELVDPQPLDALLTHERVLCCVERADAPPLAAIPLPPELSIAVGPEGGWSERERAAMAAAGVAETSLGALILRAETAAIVAAGTLMQRAWASSATPQAGMG